MLTVYLRAQIFELGETCDVFFREGSGYSQVGQFVQPGENSFWQCGEFIVGEQPVLFQMIMIS